MTTLPRLDARPDPVRLADDLIYFADHLWVAMAWDQYAKLGWVEYDILDWVQSGPSKQGVLAPRGHGKTHLITSLVPCWDWYRDLDAKCLLISKSRGHARKTLKLIRDMIDRVEFLRHLAPGPDDFDKAEMFEVNGCAPSRTPSLEALGIESQLPGTRSGRILADDIETEENTQTHEGREKLKEKARELWRISTYGDQRINFVGTFQCEDSIYKWLHHSVGSPFRSWPLVYPGPKDVVMSLSPTVQKRLDDGLNRPDDIVADYRYDQEYVDEQKSLGLSHFGRHYQMYETLGDRDMYRLRLADLIVHPVDRDVAPTKIIWGKNNGQGQSTRMESIAAEGWPGDGFYAPVMFSNDSWAPYAVTRMWVDPSGKGADKTGVAVVGQCMGHLYVKALLGLDGGTGYTVLSTIALTARRTGATEIHVEDFALQGTVAQLLQPVVRQFFVEPGQTDSDGITHPNGWRCSVELTKPIGGQTQKEQRMLSALEPVIHNHRLVVPPDVAENKRFQYQLTRLTSQRNCLGHEDELEALANCIALFSEDLRHDPEHMAAAFKQRRLDEELEKHYKACGMSVKPKRMFTPLRA